MVAIGKDPSRPNPLDRVLAQRARRAERIVGSSQPLQEQSQVAPTQHDEWPLPPTRRHQKQSSSHQVVQPHNTVESQAQQNRGGGNEGIDEGSENDGDNEAQEEAEDQARRLEAEKKELARLEKGKSRLPPFRPSLAVATNSATLSYTGTSGAAGAAASSSQKRVKFDFDYMVSSSPFSLE